MPPQPPWPDFDAPRSAPPPPEKVRSPVLLYDTRRDTRPMDQDRRDQLAGDVTQLYREKYGDAVGNDSNSADFLTAAMRPASSIYSAENSPEPDDDEDMWVDDVRMSSAEQPASETEEQPQQQTLHPPRGPSVYNSIYNAYLGGSAQVPPTPGLPIRTVQTYSVAQFDPDPATSQPTRESMAASIRCSEPPLMLPNADLYNLADHDGAVSPLLPRSSTFPRGTSSYVPSPLVLTRHSGGTARRSGERSERASSSRSVTSPATRDSRNSDTASHRTTGRVSRGSAPRIERESSSRSVTSPAPRDSRNSDTATHRNTGRVSRGSMPRSDTMSSPRSMTRTSWRSEATPYRVVTPRSVTSARGSIPASFTLSPRMYAGLVISTAPTDRWCEECGVRPRDRSRDRATVVSFINGEIYGKSTWVRKLMGSGAAELAICGQAGWC